MGSLPRLKKKDELRYRKEHRCDGLNCKSCTHFKFHFPVPLGGGTIRIESRCEIMPLRKAGEVLSAACRDFLAVFRSTRKDVDEYKRLKKIEAYKRGLESIRASGWILEKDKRERIEKRLQKHLRKYSGNQKTAERI